MHLVKWLRKNNTKIMAVVVIVILVGFIGGMGLVQLLQGIAPSGVNQVVAHYDDNEKITYDQIYIYAARELEILSTMYADRMLQNWPSVYAGFTGGFVKVDTLFLADILFQGQSISPQRVTAIKQHIQQQGYPISEKMINDIYTKKYQPSVYWFLLDKEAQKAGFAVSTEEAKNFLEAMTSQGMQMSYKQYMTNIILPPANSKRTGVSEKMALQTFAKLLAVVRYSAAMSSNELLTEKQMKIETKNNMEVMDVNYVRISAENFLDGIAEPADDLLAPQFEKFKDNVQGHISDENTYGFGYKVPDLVQFQYLLVKSADVEKIIEEPTLADAQKYYRENIDKFKQPLAIDPNDPAAVQEYRQIGFAEISDIVFDVIKSNRLVKKTTEIMIRANALTESQFIYEEDFNAITPQQFETFKDNYTAAAEKLKDEFKIDIYTGQTGMLSAADIVKDPNLGSIFAEGFGHNAQQQNIIMFSRILFAVDPINAAQISPVDMKMPKMYENIGPLDEMQGQLSCLIRIVKTQKAYTPELNTVIDKTKLQIGQTKDPEEKDYFSIKEDVADDLKKLKAYELVKTKAKEFLQTAQQTGWAQTVDSYNKLYGNNDDPNSSDPNTFELVETSLAQRSDMIKYNNLVHYTDNPLYALELINFEIQKKLASQITDLVPVDANSLPQPVVLDFDPAVSSYCIKDIKVNRVNMDTYRSAKLRFLMAFDLARFQTLAATHLNPENIVKRMNFVLVEKEDEQPENADQNSEK